MFTSFCCLYNPIITFPRSKIPVSNSVTALEIWLLTCVMLVFLSLAEYSLILWDGVKRRNDSQRKLEVGDNNLIRRRTNVRVGNYYCNARISSSHSASGPSQHKQHREAGSLDLDQHGQRRSVSRLPGVRQLEKTSAQKNRQIRQCYPGMCKHQKVLFTLKRKLYRTWLNILFSSYLDGEV